MRIASYSRSESSLKSNLKVISQWHLLARLSSRTTSPHLPWIHCVRNSTLCASAPDCPACKCHGYPVSQGSANRKEERIVHEKYNRNGIGGVVKFRSARERREGSAARTCASGSWSGVRLWLDVTREHVKSENMLWLEINLSGFREAARRRAAARVRPWLIVFVRSRTAIPSIWGLNRLSWYLRNMNLRRRNIRCLLLIFLISTVV